MVGMRYIIELTFERAAVGLAGVELDPAAGAALKHGVLCEHTAVRGQHQPELPAIVNKGLGLLPEQSERFMLNIYY